MDRKKIKQRGKERFFSNYWSTLLVALVVTLVVGGATFFTLPSNTRTIFRWHNMDNNGVYINHGDDGNVSIGNDGIKVDVGDAANVSIGNGGIKVGVGDDKISVDVGNDGIKVDVGDEVKVSIGNDGINADIRDEGNVAIDDKGIHFSDENDSENFHADWDDEYFSDEDFDTFRDDVTLDIAGWTISSIAAVSVGILLTVFLFVFFISAALKIFVLNPIYVGGIKFSINNLYKQESPKLLGAMYKGGLYGKTVLTMFLRGLFCFLWSLLLIVPGIIKFYEYRMIPFLLADKPEMTRQEVFQKSKEMMNGYKWKAFVFDLSFIGWGILNVLTLGILGIFYVNPYKMQADAALYEFLLNKDNNNEIYENYVEVQ